MDDTTSWTTRSKPPPSEREVLNVLHQDLHAAAELARTPTAAFDAVTKEVPAARPDPHGTQRIRNASREVSMARVELMKAHNRLDNYAEPPNCAGGFEARHRIVAARSV